MPRFMAPRHIPLPSSEVQRLAKNLRRLLKEEGMAPETWTSQALEAFVADVLGIAPNDGAALICVYCRTPMSSPTWEHIDNKVSHHFVANVCLCCGPCNSSKGAIPLAAWLTAQSGRCESHAITAESVTQLVKDWLAANGSPMPNEEL
jgi:hypothetical protein